MDADEEVMTGRRIILRDGTPCTVIEVAFSPAERAEPVPGHIGHAMTRASGAFVARERDADWQPIRALPPAREVRR